MSEKKLIEAFWSIQYEYKFMLDEGAVTEKPKPTWEEFAKWVYEQTQIALGDTTETEMEKLLDQLRADVKAALASGGIVEAHWADFCNLMIKRITTQFGEDEG